MVPVSSLLVAKSRRDEMYNIGCLRMEFDLFSVYRWFRQRTKHGQLSNASSVKEFGPLMRASQRIRVGGVA